MYSGVIKKDDEIIRTEDPNPESNAGLGLAYVVFGRVVRSDKVTGHLATGKARLLKKQIVVHGGSR